MKVTNNLDDEMFYVAGLLKKSRRFLDIGSNIGIYSFHFKDTFTKIDAFEPLKEITYRLTPFQNKFFQIHHVAMSSKKGRLSLYIPCNNGRQLTPLGSLEKRMGECEERLIDVNTIDSYCYSDVDLVKIDVEGHEQSVILGAVKTLQRTMPILIVEIEQRHIKKNINDVFQCILDLNYAGFFL